MATSENVNDLRLAAVLDEALGELRRHGTLDVAAWQRRYPDLADVLPSRLEMLRNLETALGDWRDAPTMSDQPQAPPVGSPAMISFTCEKCGRKLKVKPDLAGKKARCPGCGQQVQIPVGTPAAAPASPSAGNEDCQTLPPRPANSGQDAMESPTLLPRDGNASTAAANSLHIPSQATADAPVSEPGDMPPEIYDFLAPAQGANELGRLGVYRILKVLGAGGMGVVFKAEDPHLQRLVALKAMLPSLAASASARERFLREARSAAAIEHDHIVHIYQVGEDRGVPFLAMQFLRGEPLDVRLKREGRLPLPEVLRIGREAARGLAAAHKRELIHRDIKPANIWIEEENGRVKILDFGLARAARSESTLTQTGAILGTPAYMSPEQASGKPVDPRCDLFSLGCVLYELSTGQRPFKGTDTIATILAVATEQPPTPQQVDPFLPVEFSDLVMELLAKDPAGRPESAKVLADRIEQIKPDATLPASPKLKKTQKRPAAAPPATIKAPARAKPEPGAKKASRRRLPLVIGAAAAVVALIISLVVIRINTASGTVVIDSEDPDVQVIVKRGGEEIVILDAKTKQEFSLKAGTYELELKGGKGGVKLATSSFTLTRGGKEIVGVRREGGVGAAKVGPGQMQPRKIESKEMPAPATAPGKDGWVNLFNDKDLTGWKVFPMGTDDWRVENNVMIGTNNRTIFSERSDYENFHFRIEARCNAGAGQMWRAAFTENLCEGYYFEFLPDRPWLLKTSRGNPFGAGIKEEKHGQATIPPASEWRAHEIIANGDTLTVLINGVMHRQARDTTYRRGHLAFRPNNPGTKLEIRKVEIKELPAGGTPTPKLSDPIK